MTERHSEADEPQLISDPVEAAQVESENALKQFDEAMLELSAWLRSNETRLRLSLLLKLHRTLMQRLSEYAGVFRPESVKIKGSRHKPPPADQVPALVEDMCDYVNQNWKTKSAVHLAAYILWKINWIHPFTDGNGRTARIMSYFVLCARAGARLPGEFTIPEQIAANKRPYYAALEAADKKQLKSQINVEEMEALISAHLANQLLEFYRTASGEPGGLGAAEKQEIALALRSAQLEGEPANRGAFVPARQKHKLELFAWIEAHPALTGLIGVLAAAVIALIFAK